MHDFMPSLHFGEKLRFLRLQHALGQQELAEALHLVSQGFISSLEGGQRQSRDLPSMVLVLRVASLFRGVSLDYLLKDDIPPQAHTPSVVALLPPGGEVSQRFAEQLRTLRQAQGLSLQAFAHELGIASRAYFSDLERGKKLPSIDLALQLARRFDVTLDQLFGFPPSGDAGSKHELSN